jgi:hypothetical protein
MSFGAPKTVRKTLSWSNMIHISTLTAGLDEDIVEL